MFHIVQTTSLNLSSSEHHGNKIDILFLVRTYNTKCSDNPWTKYATYERSPKTLKYWKVLEINQNQAETGEEFVL